MFNLNFFLVARDNVKTPYIQMHLPAQNDYLCVSFKWFGIHAKCFGGKNGQIVILGYTALFFIFFSRCYFTRDPHVALNQKKKIFSLSYQNRILSLLKFSENHIFRKITTSFVNRLKIHSGLNHTSFMDLSFTASPYSPRHKPRT